MINVKTSNTFINTDERVLDYDAFLIRRKRDKHFISFVFRTRYENTYMEISEDGDFGIHTINKNTTISSLFDHVDLFEFIDIEDFTLNVDVTIKEG